MKLVGVDVGGTFTDIVYTDTDTNRTITHKILTTPEDPSQGVLAGLAELCERNAIERAILKGGESGAHREDFCQVQVPIRKTLLLALSEDPYFEVRAVAARALGCRRITHALYGAFAQMLPDRVFACPGGSEVGVGAGGYDKSKMPWKAWVQL